ncbi:MAG: metallopeptidase family protein [Mariprofundaceae bacterium]|nr:metallopeptidase family protein [Mariprofundaceae bacterium]
MDAAAFQALAEQAFAELPQQFLDMIENVVVFTEEWPDADVMESMGAASPGELMGLYQGWPLPERGTGYSGQLPDMIHLYRRPILSFCDETGESVEACVRHVLVHEIGHYFGFTDQEMEAIECRKT